MDPGLLLDSQLSKVLPKPGTFPAAYESTASIFDMIEEEGGLLETSETSLASAAEHAEYAFGLIDGSHEEPDRAVGAEDEEEEDFLETFEEPLFVPNPDSQDPIHDGADAFISFFSRIDIVRNTRLADMGAKKFLESLETYVPTGNSRDAPTRFLFSVNTRREVVNTALRVREIWRNMALPANIATRMRIPSITKVLSLTHLAALLLRRTNVAGKIAMHCPSVRHTS